MPEKTRELMSMAADCRKLAALAKTETVREQILEIAAQFERLAEHRLTGVLSGRRLEQDEHPPNSGDGE